MKKFILFMMAICLLSLSACKQDTAKNNSQNPNGKSIIFHINGSLPEYKAAITYSQENPRLAETLVITEKESGIQIQKIDLPENDSFSEEPLYALDITFDGNLDLLVPSQNPASAVYFQGYVWNVKENKFVYAPTFENLPNVALDSENKLILSHHTASMITSYGMSYYDNTKDDFVLENSLYWEIIDADQLFHFVEKQLQNGELKIIAEGSIATEDTSVIDKTNQNISQYFTKGSFWDLDSEKWDFCLSSVLNIK